MKTKFYPIIGYEDLYSISKKGDILAHSWEVVRPTKGSFLKRERLLTQFLNHKGYPCISLRLNGKNKTYSIHRLLAIQFIPNIHGKPSVNHKNGIKTDNRVNNLEWCTAKENSEHALLNGLYKSEKPIALVSNNGNVIKKFTSIHSASRHTGYSVSGVHQIASGITKNPASLIFIYL